MIYLRKYGINKDTYAKYVRVRRLNQRFFTNDRLTKMGIKNDAICYMCNVESDKKFPYAPRMSKIKKFLEGMERWIILTGHINKGRLISFTLLFAKLTIYSSKLKDCKPFQY